MKSISLSKRSEWVYMFIVIALLGEIEFWMIVEGSRLFRVFRVFRVYSSLKRKRWVCIGPCLLV